MLLTDEPITIADLARDLAAPLSTVAREVNPPPPGRNPYPEPTVPRQLVTANDNNPAMVPLRRLVAITFGPPHVVRDVVRAEFAIVHGVRELFIFGSWAARFLGHTGAVPADVDVLVVGPANRDDMYDAADLAARRIHREVNTTLVSPTR